LRLHQTIDQGILPNPLIPDAFFAAAYDLTDNDSPTGEYVNIPINAPENYAFFFKIAVFTLVTNKPSPTDFPTPPRTCFTVRISAQTVPQ
jgi:hypothetical protein